MTPSHQHRVNTLDKDPQTRGVLNTPNNQKKPSSINTQENSFNIAIKWLRNYINENSHSRQHGVDTLEISGLKASSIFNNPKSLFQHPKTFADTLPTNQKYPLTPCQHARKFCPTVSTHVPSTFFKYPKNSNKKSESEIYPSRMNGIWRRNKNDIGIAIKVIQKFVTQQIHSYLSPFSA